MKRTIWAIAALMVAAAAITFVACNKTDESSITSNATKNATYTVGFGKTNGNSAELTFDKELFLSTLEEILSEELSPEHEFLSEDVEIYFEEGSNGQNVPIMRVSLIETTQELGYSLFSVLEKEQQSDGVIYKANSKEIVSTCVTNQCPETCKGSLDPRTNQISGCDCAKEVPLGTIACKYVVTQRIMQDGLFAAFGRVLN